MNLAYTMQKFQDWFTQQWVIFTGRNFSPNEDNWLIGPFGEVNGIGEEFINQLAEKENLSVERNSISKGLLTSINQLNLSKNEINSLSKKVIEFYEKTSNYELVFDVKWNPFFKPFGFVVNRLFSKRINQLNIPLQNNNQEKLNSEIIQLFDKNTNELKYTIWLRKVENTGQVIYSGIYGTCKLPSNQTFIKAIFPLPKGNATVIMKPSVGKNRELILDSSGKNFGDAGFYFLLNDSKNNYWAKFVRSFTDQLSIREKDDYLIATQTLKLWNLKVSEFNYKINYTQQQLHAILQKHV
ncbi:hypothetical protein [Kaistella faecalis]|uniref:hypothetical protein n=1 Tax=Kaistella faecalis TaxID=2852098 RepID=UPI001C483545|nr:hypothetical protein [Chryseobacterium faecale]UFK97963.1 hypothetical protein LL667_01080 [Chryseobacterium faecale]